MEIHINTKQMGRSGKTSKLYTIKFHKKDVNHSENYKIKYKYIMGEDLDSNNDVVYITLLDKNENIITDQISFSIALPTEIKNEDIKIYINEQLDKTESAIYEIKKVEKLITNLKPSLVNKKNYTISSEQVETITQYISKMLWKHQQVLIYGYYYYQ